MVLAATLANVVAVVAVLAVLAMVMLKCRASYMYQWQLPIHFMLMLEKLCPNRPLLWS